MSEIDEKDIEVSDEEIEKKKRPKGRRQDGTFRKGISGNPAGRPKGTTSKLSEARLTAILNKYGAFSAEKIIEIANAEMKKGNANTALKGYALVFNQYVTAVQKQVAQDLKEATAKLVDDDEDINTAEPERGNFTLHVKV